MIPEMSLRRKVRGKFSIFARIYIRKIIKFLPWSIGQSYTQEVINRYRYQKRRENPSRSYSKEVDHEIAEIRKDIDALSLTLIDVDFKWIRQYDLCGKNSP